MIDPLAAIIALLVSDADLALLIEGRVAEKHKYALPETDVLRWPNPSKALTVQDAGGGTTDLDTPRQLPMLDARCYGESEYEAKRVYRALISITRQYERAVVETGDGKALIYYLLPNGQPRADYDAALEIDSLIVPLRAAVAEESVP